MLQFTKMARKIIHARVLGCMFRSHARNGNELQPDQRLGSSSNIWNLGFYIPVNPKLTCKSSKVAWCHVIAHICRGKNIVQFGPSFITNLLQIGASLNKKPCGSDREMCSSCCRNVITTSFCLVFSSMGNIERHDIRAKI